MTANKDVMDKVWDSSTGTLKAGASPMQTERAINDLIRRGDVEKAAQLTRAFTNTSDYKTDANAQKRLSSVLLGAKGKSNVLHAYGKAIGKSVQLGNTGDGFSLGEMAASGGFTYTDSNGTTRVADLNAQLQEDYTSQDVAASDKDDFDLLRSLGGHANYSAAQYAGALASGATAKKIGEMSSSMSPTLKASVATQFTGSQVNKLSNEAFDVVKSDLNATQYADALTSGATTEQIGRMNAELATDTAKMTATANQMTATQMQKIDNSTFMQMAKKQLQTSYAGNATALADIAGASSIADLQTKIGTYGGTAQADIQRLFSSAYSSARANKDVAKHWNADIQNILGI
jgi:hypothetical protein